MATNKTRALVAEFAFNNPDLSKDEIRQALALPEGYPIDKQIILESKMNIEQ